MQALQQGKGGELIMAQQAIVTSTQNEGMTETLAPLVWLWAIPLYIAGGFLGLLQFKLVFTGLTNAAAWRSKLWVWQRVRPSMTLLSTVAFSAGLLIHCAFSRVTKLTT